ncbi:hypothetical protein PNK_1436 [Candidatus Protochlamydia naegleriophila]|uniref:Uncharacterized protein n=1 Tax=Candidatus Protochlamydia naegleriophila TaxID=389348 RepID=A0A0U5JB36_9BACT|nr:hypothetical protein [Candidatus Protochlamydia naegleriophila]CUI17048.1 hypothetical protein PNK_1436 [Candidatus Protochlamydia naegleriophila]
MTVISRVLAPFLASPFAHISQTPREFVDNISPLTIKKITVVAACVFGGAAIGGTLALTLGMKVMILSGVGSIFGMITGFFLTVLIHKFDQANNQPFRPAVQSSTPLPPYQTSSSLKVDHIDKCVEEKYAPHQQKCIEDLANSLHHQFEINQLATNLDIDSLDQLLELNDQIQANFNCQKHTQQIYEALTIKLGKDLADRAIRHPTLLSDYLKDPYFSPSELMIHFIARRVSCYFQNEEALSELKTRVEQAVGNTTAFDEITSSHEMQDVLDGRLLLNEEMKKALFQYATEVQAENREAQATDPFELLLETIRNSSERDLFLDETFIENKFEIARAIDHFTPREKQQRRDALQRIINQAYITREFKQKIRLINGEPDEAILLACLGYTLDEHSPYYQRDLIYQIISEMVQSELQATLYIGPLNSIKELLRGCAIKARLKSIDITQDIQVKKFLIAYDLFKSIKAELKESHKEVTIPFPLDFPLPSDSIIVQSIQKDFANILSFECEKVVSHLFEDAAIREKFCDHTYSEAAFNELIKAKQTDQIDYQELEKTWVTIQRSQIFAKEIDFYEKWGKQIKAQMIQGIEDDNQVLGVGVCWGICQRICLEGEMQPHLSAEDFAKTIVIKHSDRFLQSLHVCSTRLFVPNPSLLPDPLLQKEGVESDKQVFTFNYLDNEAAFTNWFGQNSDLLAESSGWIRLSLTIGDRSNESANFNPAEAKGHALAIRYDTNLNRFWVVDPNVGFLCFENQDSLKETPESSIMHFMKELIQHYYPLTYKIRGFQHIRGEPSHLMINEAPNPMIT